MLEHGNGQVPKKYKLNPRLGGWVAAVRRRGPDALPLERRSALENAGFEWISTRKCGSAFMKNFRALRDLPKGEAPSSRSYKPGRRRRRSSPRRAACRRSGATTSRR